MPLMSVTTFQEITDRLAAQYELLVTLQNTISPVAVAATLTTALAGANNDLKFTAITAGWNGNSVTIQYLYTVSPNLPLLITQTGNAIVVRLATNGGSAITSTAAQILAAINAGFIQGQELVSAALAPGNDGTGVVTAMASTLMTGGTHGLYETIITRTNDADIEDDMTSASVNMDTLLTADAFATGVAQMTAMVLALRGHLSNQQQANLIDGFCTDNDIRMHENFDTLHNLATSSHLLGANVFTKTVEDVAIVDLTDTGNAALTLNPTGAKATVLIDPTGADNSTQYTAVVAGLSGNAITVQYVNPLANNQPLYVEVQGKDIIVHLATDAGGLVTSTAADIRAAVNANTAAAALVLATASGAETGVAAAVAPTYLTNRNTSLTFTAVEAGGDGNEVNIAYVDPGAPSAALSVVVNNKAIQVNLATDGSSVITSTAADIKTAIEASAAATALVTVVANGTVTGVVSAVPATYLGSGALATITTSNPLGSGDGQATEGNFAAQSLQMKVTPASKIAYLDLYPVNAFAFLDIDTTGTNNTLRFIAVASGTAGNAVTIELEYKQQPSVALAVAVNASAIKVTLATDVGSAISSTANAVVAAVNGTPAAAALVTASVVGLGTGLVGSRWPVTNLSNTRTKVRYTALTAGAAGENIRVRYVDPGAALQAESCAVAGNDITVNLATDAASKVISTPATIIATVNAFPAAAALVLAGPSLTNPTDGYVAAVGYTNLNYGAGPNLKRTTVLRLSLEDADLQTLTRDVTFTAGAVPNTTVNITGASASVSITPATTNNSTILWTAVTPGAAGNSITIAYTVPTTPKSPLAVSVNGNAISVSLETDQNIRPVSTADEVKTAVNAHGTAGLMVQGSVVGWGYGYLNVQAATPLAGGSDADRFFECTAVSVLSGGEGGDKYTINQIVERSVSL